MKTSTHFSTSILTLSPDHYDAFVQALDNPPAPGPKLKALLRHVPAWET